MRALQLIDEAVASGARQTDACDCLGIDPTTCQRWKKEGGGDDKRAGPKTSPESKVTPEERAEILRVVNLPQYRDLSPNTVVPMLADQGEYLASERTIYRILKEEGQLQHRGKARAPQKRHKPAEFVATAPNTVWSWDISYLKTTMKGFYFYLYMVVDIYSRKIVGWAVHDEESMEFASLMIKAAYRNEGVHPDDLALHMDNGGPMKGATFLSTLQRLGVVPSFSRPSVSNDNPYSESLFKTVKYRPEYPRAFESVPDARQWVENFVSWYNTEHLHSGIKFVTPESRHSGKDEEILRQRDEVYRKARERRPDRWSGDIRNWDHVKVVRLNPDMIKNDFRKTG